jgi:serine/threonine protein phosphatase PrpC
MTNDLFNNVFNFIDIGKREYQEDGFVSFSDRDIKKNKYRAAFVIDGHGAKSPKINIIHFLKEMKILHNEFTRFFSLHQIDSSLLINFFIDFDSKLRSDYLKLYPFLGACISGAVITQDFIYIINIGDTKTAIFSQAGKRLFETSVHDFNNPAELVRFENKKIVNGRYKGLMMSRVIGDFDRRDGAEHSLVCIPEIQTIRNNMSLFFILTTDGVTIPIKKLFSLYSKKTLAETLANKTFTDNACVTIFFNKYMPTRPVIRSINHVLLDTLLYI